MIINGQSFATFEDTWNDPNFLSSEEKAIIKLKVQLYGELIELKEKGEYTDAQISEMARVAI
jgi:hypothetical protein